MENDTKKFKEFNNDNKSSESVNHIKRGQS